MNRKINIIVAKSINNIIGNNNSLLWHIPEDLKMFKELTFNNIVVMGRKTFDSIGKPLPNRINIVLSKSYQILNEKHKKDLNIYFVYNYEHLEIFLKNNFNNKIVFIIGGESVYKYFLDNNMYDKIYLTEIENYFNGDTYFPNIDTFLHNKKTIGSGEYNGLIYNFNVYTKKLNF